jgi:uncharacterized protein YdaU (DUF1376 family)
MEDMPLHVSDWLTSETVRLVGLAGEAVYLRLLMMQWKNEGDGIPCSPDELRDLVSAPLKVWNAVWPRLEPHFPVDPDGRRRNVRLNNERAYMLERRELRRAAGQLGGLAKAQQCSSNATAKPVANRKQKSTPAPSPSPSSPDGEEGNTAALPLSGKFDDAAHADAYQRARRAARYPAALDATLLSMENGMGGPGGKPCTWHQIGTAILEAQASGRDLTPQTLRNYAAKVAARPVAQRALPFDTAVRRDGSGNIIQQRTA